MFFIRKRAKKEIERERERQGLLRLKDYVELQDALIFAQDNLIEIIEMISASKDSKECIEKLRQKYHVSAAQGQAILDMRLKALTDIEKRRLRELHQEYQDRCNEVEKG